MCCVLCVLCCGVRVRIVGKGEGEDVCLRVIVYVCVCVRDSVC